MGIRLFGAVQGLKAQVQGMLLGLGTGGNAQASEVLDGKVVTNDVGQITGTMPNEGSVTITPGPSDVPIPQGYHDGTGKALAVVVPAVNVLTGTMIAGTAGTMPNNGGVTITPGAAPQTIPVGYHDGTGTVPAVVVPTANVLTGTTIAGTAGTMPNRGAVTITPGPSDQTIPAGYHNGSGTVPAVTVPAANVLMGTTIAGTQGTMPIVGSPTITPSISGDTALSAGYYSGGTVKKAYPVGSMLPQSSISSNIFKWSNTDAGGANYTTIDSQGNSWISYSSKVIKIDVNGNTIFSTTNINGQTQNFYAITVDSSDNVYVMANGYLSVLNSSGTFLRSFFVNANVIRNLLVDSSGNIYFCNTTNGIIYKYTSTGTSVWSNSITGSALQCMCFDSSGSNLIVGYSNSSSSGYPYIRSLSLSNIQNWATNGINGVFSIAVDSSNNIFVQYGSNTNAGYFAKYTSTGSTVWTKTDVTDGYVLPGSNVAVDSSGNVYCGYYTGYLIRKLDTSGNELWRTTARPYGMALRGQYIIISDVNTAPQAIRGMYQQFMYTILT